MRPSRLLSMAAENCTLWQSKISHLEREDVQTGRCSPRGGRARRLKLQCLRSPDRSTEGAKHAGEAVTVKSSGGAFMVRAIERAVYAHGSACDLTVVQGQPGPGHVRPAVVEAREIHIDHTSRQVDFQSGFAFHRRDNQLVLATALKCAYSLKSAGRCPLDVELGTWGRDASSRSAAPTLRFGPSGDAPQPQVRWAFHGQKGASGHGGRTREIKRLSVVKYHI